MSSTPLPYPLPSFFPFSILTRVTSVHAGYFQEGAGKSRMQVELSLPTFLKSKRGKSLSNKAFNFAPGRYNTCMKDLGDIYLKENNGSLRMLCSGLVNPVNTKHYKHLQTHTKTVILHT